MSTTAALQCETAHEQDFKLWVSDIDRNNLIPTIFQEKAR